VVGEPDEAAADDPGHDADVFGKPAAGGFKARGDADALVVVALGGGLVAAVVALAAGGVVEDHDAVANAKALDIDAGSSDDAGDFMPEDAGGRVGAGVDLLEVGAADTAGVDADEDFAAVDFRDGDGLDTDVVNASVDRGAHGGGDGRRGSLAQVVRGCCSHQGL